MKLSWVQWGRRPLNYSCREDGNGGTHVGSVFALPGLPWWSSV